VKARLGADRSDLRHAYDAIIGRSPRMVEMLRMLDRATEASLPVVIHGESGTGKELVARALHDNGPRRQAPFVAINCGAVPEQLLESELFGHVRGAFTGADRDRRGVFEVASGGSLFLDEVADTSLAMQAKLLRVLQDGEIRRVGDDRVRRVDVRVIAASNRRLADLVAAGRFREDLYYRLDVLSIDVPPLRERVGDIPAIAEYVLNRLGGSDAPPRLSKAALARLCAHRWPGNVRELENELSRAWALADQVIDVGDLSPHVAAATAMDGDAADDDLELRRRVESLERTLVERALSQTHGNQSAAAKLLGLSRYGLQKKLRRYGIAGSVR
jgi:transcriptional regulator with PAS, ATPase and Fis domain